MNEMLFGRPSRQRSRYRSARSVRPQHVPTHMVTNWTKTKVMLVIIGISAIAMTFLVPIIFLEAMEKNPSSPKVVSLHNIMETSKVLEKDLEETGMSFVRNAKAKLLGGHLSLGGHFGVPEDEMTDRDPFELHDGVGDEGHPEEIEDTLARGAAGLPMELTPALVGAKPGHIECDVYVDDMPYWNSPQGYRDQEFQSPFATSSPMENYLTFEPDQGGWNNIRMSTEIIFVLAAATGRTLVLPPNQPMYLLGTGAAHARSFGSFYSLKSPEIKRRVKVITMTEFLEKEWKNILGLSEEQYKELLPVTQMCLHQPKSEIFCDKLYDLLRNKGHQPNIHGTRNCFIFDKDYFETGKPIPPDVQEKIDRFCTKKPEDKEKGKAKELSDAVYYDQTLHSPKLLHLNAAEKSHRLLNHFYTFLYFTDPKIDNYYKRFVRDFLHYVDEIYCAAGKIVHALNSEGPWSSLHVRRGDLQFKKVKIPAEEWYENAKEVWNKGEILFIATDERNKTFFDPIKEHHNVRFLDDYWDLAKLDKLDSYYLGMIDTIVASHGRTFTGTWFSTFTGYINRMRGYLGYSIKDSWYSWLPRKDAVREWKYPDGSKFAREWPLGWTAIDGDEWIEHENIPEGQEEEVEHDEDGEKSAPRTIPDSSPKGKAFDLANIKQSDLPSDSGFQEKELARGVAGRPASETPALAGAKRAHIECDVGVDSLAYWNSPTGNRDQEFESPFKAQGGEKFLTFSIDRGGWNNVRMSMEIIFIIAAATGRTLVLPPKEPLYRLAADKKNKWRGFADFFNLDTPEFAKRMKIISFEEFVKQEGGADGSVPITESMRDNVMNSASHCDKRKASSSFCGHIEAFLNQTGFTPDFNSGKYCVVFDKDKYGAGTPSASSEESISKFCGERTQYYFTEELEKHALVHIKAGEKEHRLLTHFYDFIHFTNPSIDNYFKRFVRDFLHYNDEIYCAAGKIIKALQLEAQARGFYPDENVAGGYSAMHIRRGELQYKKVKIPAELWYENTKEVWKPREIIYIATDERNKTFFDPIAAHHDLRFLDDYFELAGLDKMDPNYFGMIDTIIASRGRAFAGTFFSTFSGYINRLRGYQGMTMKDSWYSFLDKKTRMHEWIDVDTFIFSFEWPTGWVGIDADVVPSKETF